MKSEGHPFQCWHSLSRGSFPSDICRLNPVHPTPLRTASLQPVCLLQYWTADSLCCVLPFPAAVPLPANQESAPLSLAAFAQSLVFHIPGRHYPPPGQTENEVTGGPPCSEPDGEEINENVRRRKGGPEMGMRTRIVEKLAKLNPSYLEVINDSHAHAGHAAMKGNPSAESHFIVKISSAEFEGKSLLARHRLVYSLLDEEMKQIHALNIIAKT